MPGFFISNIEKSDFTCNNKEENYINDEIRYDSFICKRNTLNKFINDKCLRENSSYIVIAEGVLLNKLDLFDYYKVSDVFSLIIKMYEEKGESFFDAFRGSFSGAVYCKDEQKWIIYTNHYGDNTIYYYYNSGRIVIGSEINFLIECLNNNNIQLSVNEYAAESILTYGYLSNDSTYANEIKRLYPGHYIVYKEKSLSIKKYYSLKTEYYDLHNKTEDEVVEKLDTLFRQAIKLEYDKDVEYGYRHITQLSGGLDSRMNLWVASALGYKNILCVNFSQSGSLDDLISNQIAKYLKTELIHFPLDSANHLLHIDEYIQKNAGSCWYSAIGGMQFILEALDMNKFGLGHTGQLGDVVIGSYLKSAEELYDMSLGGNYSNKISFNDICLKNNNYSDREEYLMFVRGFLGTLSSHLFYRKFSEVASPFLNIDLFNYCMSIPVELRVNHHIYKKWILKKYPDAAEFIWEKTGRKIYEKNPNKYICKIKRVIKEPKIIVNKLKRKNVSYQLSGMNPYDLWFNENEKIRLTLDNYYNDWISCANGAMEPALSDSLRKKLISLYKEGNCFEKILVITVISALKLYFNKNINISK